MNFAMLCVVDPVSAMMLRPMPHETKAGIIAPECQKVLGYIYQHRSVPHGAQFNKANALRRLHASGFLSMCEDSLSGYKPSLMMLNSFAASERLFAEQATRQER